MGQIGTCSVKILIDNGSDVDLISCKLVHRLKLSHQSVASLSIGRFIGDTLDYITHFFHIPLTLSGLLIETHSFFKANTRYDIIL
jgi:hypothetical protein